MTNKNQTSTSFVIHSVFDGKYLIENILKKYLGCKIISCKLYKAGLNDTYLVEAELEQYILRVYRREWRNKQEIDFEFELLDFLQKNHQPVASPISLVNGVFTTEVGAPEGVRYAAVFRYAPGKAVNENINSIQSYKLGELLAKIHTVTNNFQSSFNRPELDGHYLLNWSIKNIKDLCNVVKIDVNDLEQEIEKIKQQLEKVELSLSSPEYGICMGDLHFGNAHFTADNQPTLFDFDQCGYGWHAFDIAKCLHSAIRKNIDEEVRLKFIEGYETVRKLSQTEILAIPIFIKAAHIWVMGIAASAAKDVLGYGSFDQKWLNTKLDILRTLDL